MKFGKFLVQFLDEITFCFYFKPLTIVGDLSKECDVEKVIDTTVKEFGQIDILVSLIML